MNEKCEECGAEMIHDIRCKAGAFSGKSQTTGWVSNEAQYRKVLECIVKYGERQGIKRSIQLCDMTLKGMDVFTDSRMKR